MQEFPLLLVSAGLLLIVVGAVWLVGEKYLHLGRLPGDIIFERENFKVYIPLATSLLISIVLSTIMFLVYWLRR